jgi:drug/metabolite transporter (DMT)-like permease
VPFVALIAMLGGAATAAESGVVAKRFPRTHPLSTNAVGMLVGGALLVVLSFAVAEAHPLPQRLDTQIALLYLATIGAVGLFALFLFVLGRWTASASSYSIVIMPLVAIAAGALLRGEAVSPFFIVGAIVVGVGVYIGALSG